MRRVVIFMIVYFSNSYVFCTGVKAQERDVRIQSVPFVASLLALRGATLRHVCGASVLHEKFLLTAASCFVGQGFHTNQTKVLVGTDILENGGQIYDVELLVPHKKYFIQTGDYNVGLIKVKQRLAFGPKVGPVELGRGKVKVGSLVNVVGWGTNMKQSARVLPRLRQASIPVLRARACQGGLGRVVTSRAMCAGVARDGEGDCVSDEGGPVFSNSTLIGVVTPFSGCGRLPGLYTRVGALRGWLTATMDGNLSYLDYFDEEEHPPIVI